MKSFTLVKSALIKACSKPEYNVIGITNICFLFLICFSVFTSILIELFLGMIFSIPIFL